MHHSHTSPAPLPRIWDVSALCLAAGQALDARFNPVTVRGELSGLSRAASGHWYFNLKDAHGQLRCAMFRRAASAVDFVPRDGDQVEVMGRLGVYEARGDLQLVAESLQRSGQGQLFEQFLRLKALLQSQGLLDAQRKRALPAAPRAIGVVTSPDAAAWRDVMAAMQRRAPHVPVYMAPARVQGAGAAAELVLALQRLTGQGPLGRELVTAQPLDVILLVRGGGSMEDLWAFNDESLARAIAACPVPVISGVGHETDFTLADFVADVRAPTPTAAAELAATPQAHGLQQLAHWGQRTAQAVQRQSQAQSQRLDRAHERLVRPQAALAMAQQRLQLLAARLPPALAACLAAQRHHLTRQSDRLRHGVQRAVDAPTQRLMHLQTRLAGLDPQLVLQRGYAWLCDEQGQTLSQTAQFATGQLITATVSDGQVGLKVRASAGAQKRRPKMQ